MDVRHYLGIAERGDEGWWISFPAFPGVVSAGGTLAELLANARDALESAIGAMHEDGDTVPAGLDANPTSGEYDPADYRDPRAVIVQAVTDAAVRHIDITLDQALVSRLDDLGQRIGTDRSALVTRGVQMVLAEDGAS